MTVFNLISHGEGASLPPINRGEYLFPCYDNNLGPDN